MVRSRECLLKVGETLESSPKELKILSAKIQARFLSRWREMCGLNGASQGLPTMYFLLYHTAPPFRISKFRIWAMFLPPYWRRPDSLYVQKGIIRIKISFCTPREDIGSLHVWKGMPLMVWRNSDPENMCSVPASCWRSSTWQAALSASPQRLEVLLAGKQQPAIFPADFSIDLLRNLPEEIADSNHMIAKCLATDSKCKQVAKHPDCKQLTDQGRGVLQQSEMFYRSSSTLSEAIISSNDH